MGIKLLIKWNGRITKGNTRQCGSPSRGNFNEKTFSNKILPSLASSEIRRRRESVSKSEKETNNGKEGSVGRIKILLFLAIILKFIFNSMSLLSSVFDKNFRCYEKNWEILEFILMHDSGSIWVKSRKYLFIIETSEDNFLTSLPPIRPKIQSYATVRMCKQRKISHKIRAIPMTWCWISIYSALCRINQLNWVKRKGVRAKSGKSTLSFCRRVKAPHMLFAMQCLAQSAIFK